MHGGIEVVQKVCWGLIVKIKIGFICWSAVWHLSLILQLISCFYFAYITVRKMKYVAVYELIDRAHYHKWKCVNQWSNFSNRYSRWGKEGQVIERPGKKCFIIWRMKLLVLNYRWITAAEIAFCCFQQEKKVSVCISHL